MNEYMTVSPASALASLGKISRDFISQHVSRLSHPPPLSLSHPARRPTKPRVLPGWLRPGLGPGPAARDWRRPARQVLCHAADPDLPRRGDRLTARVPLRRPGKAVRQRTRGAEDRRQDRGRTGPQTPAPGPSRCRPPRRPPMTATGLLFIVYRSAFIFARRQYQHRLTDTCLVTRSADLVS